MDDFDIRKVSKVTLGRLQTRPFLRRGISVSDVNRFNEKVLPEQEKK